MRENRTSGSMRGRRRRAVTYRACVLLYGPRGEETVGFVPLGLQLERVRGVGVEDGWQRFRRRQRRPGIGQSRSFQ